MSNLISPTVGAAEVHTINSVLERGAGHLLCGLPDPDTLFVDVASSVIHFHHRQAIHKSRRDNSHSRWLVLKPRRNRDCGWNNHFTRLINKSPLHILASSSKPF